MRLTGWQAVLLGAPSFAATGVPGERSRLAGVAERRVGNSRQARTVFRSRLNFCTFALLLFSIHTTLQAQQQETAILSLPADISFQFERPGLTVPRYRLEIAEKGLGAYSGEELPVRVGHPDTPPSPQPFALKTFHVSPATTAKVFALARSLNHFNIPCASTVKNVADTGKKTLDYIHLGADRFTGSCTYNYTENKDVQTLTDIFEGIAETLDEGRRLDYLHRYDRLGLDTELESFSREVADGHAIELQAIAETLRSLAGDPEVMQRVRTRASALLTLVPAETRQSAQ